MTTDLDVLVQACRNVKGKAWATPQPVHVNYLVFRVRVEYRKLLRRKMLQRLCEAQNWKCCYCGTLLTEAGAEMATRDHILPVALKGSDEWENLVAACAFCNGARGTMRAERFFAIVATKGRKRASGYASRMRRQFARLFHTEGLI